MENDRELLEEIRRLSQKVDGALTRLDDLEKKLSFSGQEAKPSPAPNLPPKEPAASRFAESVSEPAPPPRKDIHPLPPEDTPPLLEPPTIPPPPIIPETAFKTHHEEQAASAPAVGFSGEPREARSTNGQALEALMGGKWTMWLGILALFFALAFFLREAWQDQRMGPTVQILLSGLAGVGFLAAGEISRKRFPGWYGESLSAAGIAILFLTTWAAGERFNFLTYGQAFFLMAVVSGLGAVLSLRHSTWRLLLLAGIGAYLTPVMLSGDAAGGGPVGLLLYLLAVNAGILGVGMVRNWSGLYWMVFAGTVTLVSGWAVFNDSASAAWAFLILLTALYLEGAAAVAGRSWLHRQASSANETGVFALASFFMILSGDFALREAAGGSVLYNGVYSVAMAILLMGFYRMAKRLLPWDAWLHQAALGSAILAVTIALALRLDLNLLGLAWMVESAVLLYLAASMKSRLLRFMGQALYGLGLALAVYGAIDKIELLYAYLAVAIAVSVFLLWNCKRSEQREDDFDRIYSWVTFFLGAWLAGKAGGDLANLVYKGSDVSAVAYQAAVALLGIYSAVAFVLAVRLKFSEIRWFAIALLFLISLFSFTDNELMNRVIDGTVTGFWPYEAIRLAVTAVLMASIIWIYRYSRDQASEAFSYNEARGAEYFPAMALLLGTVSIALSVIAYVPEKWFAGNAAELLGPIELLAICAVVAVYSFAGFLLSWRAAVQPAQITAVLLLGACLVLAMIAGLNTWSMESRSFVNIRFITLLITVACFWGSLSMLMKKPELKVEPWMPGMLVLVMLMAVGWGVTMETFVGMEMRFAETDENWRRYAQLAISLEWIVAGLALILGGIWKKERYLRLAGLAVMGLATWKVFLYDLAFLDEGLRVLSFAALGVSMLGISYLYSKLKVAEDQVTT